jgi:molecular chaperone GrpE
MVDKRADAAAAYAKAPSPPENETPVEAEVDAAAPAAASTDAAGPAKQAGAEQDSDTEQEVGAGREPGAGSGDGGAQVVADLDELSARAQKADEYLELARRTQADFENYRKRAAREAMVAQERGVAKLARELLPAIDNLERAIVAHPQAAEGSEAAQMLEGIKLVQADLLAALRRVGIEPFSPVGEQFDPQYHEAVAQNHVEGIAAGTVVEVLQQGDRHGETVLRAARVLVAA